MHGILLSETRPVISVKNMINGKAPLVLVYHSIGVNGGFDNIKKSTFESHISWLSNNCKIVSLKDIVLSSKEKVKKVVITFDDGLKSFHENAAPILRKYDVPATVFVVSAALQNTPPPTVEYIVKERLQSPENLMTREQLLALTEEPLFTIGSHSATHQKLPKIENQDRVIREVRKSKIVLESELEVDIDIFSYPNYRYDKKSRKLVSKYYSRAVKGDGGTTVIDRSTDPYLIPRVSGARSINKIKFILIDTVRIGYDKIIKWMGW